MTQLGEMKDSFVHHEGGTQEILSGGYFSKILSIECLRGLTNIRFWMANIVIHCDGAKVEGGKICEII